MLGVNKNPIEYITYKEGGNQPPKKKITVKVDIRKILVYSPIKNKAKPTAEYSTL